MKTYKRHNITKYIVINMIYKIKRVNADNRELYFK